MTVVHVSAFSCSHYSRLNICPTATQLFTISDNLADFFVTFHAISLPSFDLLSSEYISFAAAADDDDDDGKYLIENY